MLIPSRARCGITLFSYYNLWLISDTTPPVVTCDKPPKQTNGVVLLRWTSNENSVFHCSLGGLPYKNCGQGLMSQWTGSALDDGEHTLKVRATDDAGNIATPTPCSWQVGKDDNFLKVEHFSGERVIFNLVLICLECSTI